MRRSSSNLQAFYCSHCLWPFQTLDGEFCDKVNLYFSTLVCSELSALTQRRSQHFSVTIFNLGSSLLYFNDSFTRIRIHDCTDALLTLFNHFPCRSTTTASCAMMRSLRLQQSWFVAGALLRYVIIKLSFRLLKQNSRHILLHSCRLLEYYTSTERYSIAQQCNRS